MAERVQRRERGWKGTSGDARSRAEEEREREEAHQLLFLRLSRGLSAALGRRERASGEEARARTILESLPFSERVQAGVVEERGKEVKFVDRVVFFFFFVCARSLQLRCTLLFVRRRRSSSSSSSSSEKKRRAGRHSLFSLPRLNTETPQPTPALFCLGSGAPPSRRECLAESRNRPPHPPAKILVESQVLEGTWPPPWPRRGTPPGSASSRRATTAAAPTLWRMRQQAT